MTMIKHTLLAGLALSTMLALVGCSTTPSGSDAAVSVAGLVGGSSSLLTMNGAPLDLSGASISVDGETATAADIKPGMEVEGDGNDERGRLRMRHIEGRWRAKGMVDEVNTSDGYIDVVGLRAYIGDTTRMVRENPDGSETPITLADIQAGDHLRVAGLSKPDDSVAATRVELKREDNANQTGLQVRLRKLDTAAKTFSYGLQTYQVDYSAARVIGSLAEGEFFRLRGLKDGSTIKAELIRSFAPEQRPQGRRIELKGLISDLNTEASTFVLRGFSVYYGRASVTGQLANGAMVEVKGLVSGEKKVDAVKVEVEGSERPKPLPGREGKLEGPISAFDSSSKTLKIAEVSVSTKATTKYQIAQAEVSPETFWGTSRDGQKAQARGRIVNGSLEADKLEIE